MQCFANLRRSPACICQLRLGLVAEMKFTGATSKAFPERPATQQRWFIFRFDAVEMPPERCSHSATGSREEHGLIFDYFWHPLAKMFSNAHLDSDRRFATVIDALLTHR